MYVFNIFLSIILQILYVKLWKNLQRRFFTLKKWRLCRNIKRNVQKFLYTFDSFVNEQLKRHLCKAFSILISRILHGNRLWVLMKCVLNRYWKLIFSVFHKVFRKNYVFLIFFMKGPTCYKLFVNIGSADCHVKCRFCHWTTCRTTWNEFNFFTYDIACR